MCSGVYSIDILDDIGCSVTAFIGINDSSGPLGETAITNDPTCFGSNDGSITVSANGGIAPYGYYWLYDGSTNISKIITEFGIFGIIFMLTFIYTALKSNDFESKKFFLISLISLQFLRGVGYFNGGFLLVVILYFFNYLKIREKMIKFKNLK